MKEGCRRIARSTLLDAETLLHEPENPPARTVSPRKSRTQVTLLGPPEPPAQWSGLADVERKCARAADLAG